MKLKFYLTIITFVLLSACNIISPITTTTKFLEALEAKNFTQAANYLIKSDQNAYSEEEKVELAKKLEAKLGTIADFNDLNAVALSPGEIADLHTNEAYTVFFDLKMENYSTMHEKVIAIKIGSDWKLIYQFN